MQKPKNIKLPWLLTGAAIVVAVALGWFYPKNQDDKPKVDKTSTEISVGYLPIYVDLPLFVAVEEGLFEKRGLTVSLVRFQNSPDMGAALVSGRINAVASIATPTAVSIEDRDPGQFRVFMVDQATVENPLSSLMIPSSSTVSSISELEEKNIAAFPGPTTTILTPLAFSRDGLQKGQYNLTDAPPSSHISLLETGRIDAVVTYEPLATQAEIKNGSKRLVRGFIESKLMNPWPAGSWLISSSYLSNSSTKDTGKLFYEALFEATDMLRRSPQKMKVHLAKYTPIEAHVSARAPNIPFTKAWEVNLDSFQGYADLLLEQGYLSKKIDMQKLLIDSMGH